MTKMYSDITSLIGNTPNIAQKPIKDKAQVYAKLECANPTGSIFDRAASTAIDQALTSGQLSSGGTMLVATNNGRYALSLCVVGAAKGLSCVVVLPSSVDKYWLEQIQLYCVLVEQVEGNLQNACVRVDTMSKSIFRGAFVLDSDIFHTMSTVYLSIGQEIYKDFFGKVSTIVVPMLSSQSVQSLSIISTLFANKGLQTKIVGCKISEEQSLLQDSTINVGFEQAEQMSKQYAKQTGISIDVLSASSLFVANNIATKSSMNKNIVAVLCNSKKI